MNVALETGKSRAITGIEGDTVHGNSFLYFRRSAAESAAIRRPNRGIHHSQEKFRFEASFRTWLVRIAHNEAGQNWRKQFTAHKFTQDQPAFTEWEATDPNGSPFNAYVRNQTTQSIRLALASLPEKYRAVVHMRDIEERSIAEVAEAMRLTISAVKTRQRRGRLIMAGILFGKNKSAVRRTRV